MLTFACNCLGNLIDENVYTTTSDLNGIILDTETNLPIASASITVFSNNSKLKKVLANENGNFNLELGCSTNFDLVVNAPGYQSNSFIIIYPIQIGIRDNETINLNNPSLTEPIEKLDAFGKNIAKIFRRK